MDPLDHPREKRSRWTQALNDIPRLGEPTLDHKKTILVLDRLWLLVVNIFKALVDLMHLHSIWANNIFEEIAQDVLNHIIWTRASCSSSKPFRKGYNQFKWQYGLLFRNTLLYFHNSLSQLLCVVIASWQPTSWTLWSRQDFEASFSKLLVAPSSWLGWWLCL